MNMRKLLFIATTVAAISAFAPASASASPSHAQFIRPAAVFGYGSLGQFGNPSVQMGAVQAFSRPTGEFVIAYPDGSVAFGAATCVFVTGHTAYLTGRIIGARGPRQQANNWSVGNYIVIGVLDTGEPVSVSPDLLNFSPGLAANPGCGPNAEADPVFPITRGNFLVSGGS